MERNICLHFNGADSTLSSLTWPYHSWRICFTLEKSSKPHPPSLSNSSSRNLCPWSLLFASSFKENRCPRWAHQWATNNRATLSSLWGFWKKALGTKKFLGKPRGGIKWKGSTFISGNTKESLNFRKCLFTLLLHRFNCGKIYQSQLLTSCAQHYINKVEEAAPWPQNIQCHTNTEKETSSSEVKGTLSWHSQWRIVSVAVNMLLVLSHICHFPHAPLCSFPPLLKFS